jgi:hypothetical protein
MWVLGVWDVPWYGWAVSGSVVGVFGALLVAYIAYRGQRHLKLIEAIIAIRKHLDFIIQCLESLPKQKQRKVEYDKELHKHNMEYTAVWRATSYLFPKHVYRRFREIDCLIEQSIDLIESQKPYSEQLSKIHQLTEELDGWLNYLSDKSPTTPTFKIQSEL